MKIYNLLELNKLSEKLKFNRDTLEKVLRLVELLRLFNEHEELKGKYVLKGGTAINLCLSNLPRLSVDIDLDFSLKTSKDELERIRMFHKKIICDSLLSHKYIINNKSRFSYSLDSYLLQYTNAIGNNDYIKLEINYSNRVHIIKPKVYRINSEIVDDINVLAMDEIELYASKIEALIGRTTIRDVFDVFEMVNNNYVKKDDNDMLRKSSIFYLLLSNKFQPLEDLLKQFKENISNIEFHNIKKNLIPMLKIGVSINIENLKTTVNEFVDELFVLDENEKKYIELYNSGIYQPSLLFDDATSDNLKNHPMVEWKMRNFQK